MNESRVQVSPLQLRAQESQSCVQWERSPLCLVSPARLSVKPVLLLFTVEKQVSQLQPDHAVMVSSCITTQIIMCCAFFAYHNAFCGHLDRLLVSPWSDCGYSFAVSSRPLLPTGQCSSRTVPTRNISGQRETGRLCCLCGR